MCSFEEEFEKKANALYSCFWEQNFLIVSLSRVRKIDNF